MELRNPPVGEVGAGVPTPHGIAVLTRAVCVCMSVCVQAAQSHFSHLLRSQLRKAPFKRADAVLRMIRVPLLVRGKLGLEERGSWTVDSTRAGFQAMMAFAFTGVDLRERTYGEQQTQIAVVEKSRLTKPRQERR